MIDKEAGLDHCVQLTGVGASAPAPKDGTPGLSYSSRAYLFSLPGLPYCTTVFVKSR